MDTYNYIIELIKNLNEDLNNPNNNNTYNEDLKRTIKELRNIKKYY